MNDASDEEWIEADSIVDVSSQHSSKEDLSSSEVSTSLGSPERSKKLKNRPITREELANNSDSYTSETYSQSLGNGTLTVESGGAINTVEAGTQTANMRGVNEMSIGTDLHEFHICKPCILVSAKLYCLSGKECKFCHHPSHHSWQQGMQRPSRLKRERYKKLIARYKSGEM